MYQQLSLAPLIALTGLLALPATAGTALQNPFTGSPHLMRTLQIPNTPVESVLYPFQGGADGGQPQAGLIADKVGALYGTTASGGNTTNCSGGCGTVFKLAPSVSGYTKTILYAFNGGATDGANPVARLIADKTGALYGTTAYGGNAANCSGGCGTVFKLTPSALGYKENVIYAFLGGTNDGAFPTAELAADKAGVLYGTTQNGGVPQCIPSDDTYWCGTVFKLTPSASGYTETVIYDFKGNGLDGYWPVAGVIVDKTGALYGTTSTGSNSGCSQCVGGGIVFKLTPNGSTYTETVIHAFGGGGDGFGPTTGVIADESGALYGTTPIDGTCNRPSGCGLVYKLTPAGSGYAETVLYNFQDGFDGANPSSSLTMNGYGALFGVTSAGGASAACGFTIRHHYKIGCGTVFQLTRGSKGYTHLILHRFQNGNDGSNPEGALILDKAGALYGATVGGGASGQGTVFKVTR